MDSESGIISCNPLYVYKIQDILELENIRVSALQEAQKLEKSFTDVFGIDDKIELNRKTGELYIHESTGGYSAVYKIKDVKKCEIAEIPEGSKLASYMVLGESLGGVKGRNLGAALALDSKNKLSRVECWITVANAGTFDVIKARIYAPIFSFDKNNQNYQKAVIEIKKAMMLIEQLNNSNINQCQPSTQTSSEKLSVNIVNDLKTLKELLDEGLITQEDYDKKKKKLLNI